MDCSDFLARIIIAVLAGCFANALTAMSDQYVFFSLCRR
jgi:hypothetical protein